MKRLDRLIFGEMLGPWLFGVAIFTVLIMAGTYLFQITGYVVDGISPLLIGELTVLLLPGILAKTFSMATLLAALLAFGRLSSDSEIVALKAHGASVARMMVPVALFGLLASLLAFTFNEVLVPGAAIRATAIQQEIGRRLEKTGRKEIFQPIYEGARLVAMVTAQDFDLRRRTLDGAIITTFDKKGQPALFMMADRLRFNNANQWRIENGARILSSDGRTLVDVDGDVWPDQVPEMTATPEDILARDVKNLDALSMRELRRQIQAAQNDKTFDKGGLANLEFGYWNKIAVPAAAAIFALVGAPLAIRSHRSTAATGFWLAVVIIFAYMMLANFGAIWAQGGQVPPFIASFAPIAIGAFVAAVLIHRKNR